MKKWLERVLTALFVLMMVGVVGACAEVNELVDGVNVIRQGAEGLTFDIDEGKAVMIGGTKEEPIVFRDCTFNLSGKTMKISGNQDGLEYASGETAPKIWIGENVQFDDCAFIGSNGGKSTSAGWDACIYFSNGEITLNGCKITGTDWQGQFMGLYGKRGSVTFNGCDIATVGNTGGWSYAMYGFSVLNLNHSKMTATGMKRSAGGGNVNAFYAGDLSETYDALNIENSVVDFSDNYGGGFALNNVNIHVKDSKIQVNDNLANACNSGYWIVDNSEIAMNGNRGGHALSCIGFEMKNSTFEVLHNGYAGVYVQSRNSSFTDCVVNVRCNGEKMLGYSAGDVWLNGYTLSLNHCPSVWLGGVGRKGQVFNNGSGDVVAYDLYENKCKGGTAPVLNGVALSGQEKHTLFLNPSKELFDYARGDTEGDKGNSNDDDLFEDVGKEVVIGKSSAKIGELTTAQLSHHKYDWENYEVMDDATEGFYGVKRYMCVDVCAPHMAWTDAHPDSFDCEGTYIYAPLVGLAFHPNAENVTDMPENQVQIEYNTACKNPGQIPLREGYRFTGWYVDELCTTPFDFESKLTANWTDVYAGWIQQITVNYVWVDLDVVDPTKDTPCFPEIKIPDSVKIDKGTAFTSDREQHETEESRKYYTFEGGYTEEECVNLYEDGTVLNKDTTLYGKWKHEPITVNYVWVGNAKPGDVKPPLPDTVEKGMVYKSTPQDATDEDYYFYGWYTDAECKTPYADNTVLDKDTTLYGRWERKPVEAGNTPIKIVKIWDDDGYSGRPREIHLRVTAYTDPDFLYNKTLTANTPGVSVSDGGDVWTFTGSWCRNNFKVEELPVPGYTAKVVENGTNDFIITNSYMPATGDGTPVKAYLALIGGAALVGVCVVAMRRRKRA